MKIKVDDSTLRVGTVPKEAPFHRVVLTPSDVLTVTPRAKRKLRGLDRTP